MAGVLFEVSSLYLPIKCDTGLKKQISARAHVEFMAVYLCFMGTMLSTAHLTERKERSTVIQNELRVFLVTG